MGKPKPKAVKSWPISQRADDLEKSDASCYGSKQFIEQQAAMARLQATLRKNRPA